jgi:hypothetical protein
MRGRACGDQPACTHLRPFASYPGKITRHAPDAAPHQFGPAIRHGRPSPALRASAELAQAMHAAPMIAGLLGIRSFEFDGSIDVRAFT